jgi:hypothetical protein
MKKRLLYLSFIIITSLLLSGCNYPGRQTPTSQVDAMNTIAAQTIQAQQTIIAQTNQSPTGNDTPTPTQEITSTEEEAPGPTNTSTSTQTQPPPTATATEDTPCDRAAFVSETIPDGTDFSPGQAFTKIWTLKNTGSCTWNANYDVVFVSGDAMNAPAAAQLTSGSVAPGQSIQISLDLVAPTSAGTHRGEFKLRNDNGVLFGIGDNNGEFWVEIEIAGTLYNFVDNYCASGVTWISSKGSLSCPGTSGDTEGWVYKVNNPKLENGTTDNEAAILMHPAMENNGWIKGIFPEMTVTGDVKFKAVIGCYYGALGCDVKFKLNYKIDGGAETTLATWHEVLDDSFTKVNLDISSLAGKDVTFILVVEANGDFNLDEALWLQPRIEP